MGEDTELIDNFLACATGVLGVIVETGAFGIVWCGVRVDTVSRVGVDFAAAGEFELAVEAEGAREARGVVREFTFSILGLEVVDGRFAAAAVPGVRVERLSDGVALPAAVLPVPAVPTLLRTAGFLLSSTADCSDSVLVCAAAAFVPSAVRLAAVPAGARVGGLLKLEPVLARREVELVSGRDALLAGRVVVFVVPVVLVDAAAGRRTAAEAVVVPPAVGRRGGTGSFFVTEGALEAILRRRTDECC